MGFYFIMGEIIKEQGGWDYLFRQLNNIDLHAQIKIFLFYLPKICPSFSV
jgi:hypothetical protein